MIRGQGVDEDHDSGTVLERRLRGARERVERIRLEAEGASLKGIAVARRQSAEGAHEGALDVAGSEDLGEMMAVLDILGRGSVKAEDHDAFVEHRKPVVLGPRPPSASSQRRLDMELNYGGVGLGAAAERPEWQ